MFPALWRPILILLLAGLSPGLSRAQNYLVLEVKGEGKVVRKISGPITYVMEDGKLTRVRGTRSGLVPATEFMPVFVAVRDVDAHTSAVALTTGHTINNDFSFRATFESSYWLDDVFFVLELEPKRGGKRIHSEGVGNLEPGKPRRVSITVPLMEELGEGRYQLHVFSQGREVFSSAQPQELREQALDQMVGKRIAGTKDALPTPLLGPPPEYPRHLLKTRGEAVVKVHISPTGQVGDPQVESATDPAFGEAAVAAVRQWRFVPRVKEGQPVETTASLPFAFDPPGEPKKN